MNPTELETVLVNDVWGVGRQICKQLIAAGVNNVLDLVSLDLAMINRRFSVVLERTVRELQGTPCIDLDQTPAPRKEIACTRSFCHPARRAIDGISHG